MKNIIIIEYFTSSPDITQNFHKNIYNEGLKICDSISLNLKQRTKTSNIVVLRNEKFKIPKNSKVLYKRTSEKISFLKHLSDFDSKDTNIILISPESNMIAQSIYKLIEKIGFNILISDLFLIKLFSSKKKTIKFLKKIGIPCVNYIEEIENINCDRKFVLKPEYGAGSENVYLLTKLDELKKLLKKVDYPCIVQHFKSGLAGSINILCFKNTIILLSCNKHILKFDKGTVKQIGSLVGGLENYRRDLQSLVDNIGLKIKGLYGFISMDVILVKKIWNIVEVNPRISTTYCGLKNAFGKDITNLISDLYLGKKNLNVRNFGLKKPVELIF